MEQRTTPAAPAQAPNGAADPAAPSAQATSPTAGLTGITPSSGRNDPRRRLGDVIIELGFADRELVEQVMSREAESKRPMGEVLVQSGMLTAGQLAQALAERNALDYIDLNAFNVDKGAANLINMSEAKRYRAIPGRLPPRQLAAGRHLGPLEPASPSTTSG